MEQASGKSRRRPRASRARQLVVERAEAYMRAHLGTQVPMSRLCRVVGVSERGLRNAFYGVRGMSPTRCMKAERLRSVRQALSGPTRRTVTVTSIAADYGFYELGRFAATYREAFGEAPSETLRRTGGRLASEEMASTRGQIDVCTN